MRASLETSNADFTAYDGVFSMLDERREPDLPPGVIRISMRDPVGQCLARMKAGGNYLLYCNSGKLSLVLVTQIRKSDSEIGVVSLRGGKV